MDYQQELITTIHDFGCDLSVLEARMEQLSQESPTAVLIPALFEELERPALTQIRDHLIRCVGFVNTVVVCLYAQTTEQYRHAVQFFDCLPQKTYVIWENGPGVTRLLASLQDQGLNLLSFRGKGRAVWLGLGVATLEADAIALHDADITTYDRTYPLKLLYPLLEKEFGIAFNKAYYARLGDPPSSFYGRVVRLFVTPLLTAMIDLFGAQNYLCYLNAYRYPLSGEFALTSDLALNIRIPSNWGLEIGFLAEVYRNIALKRIAQVDLGLFEHKHQALGLSTDEGLQKMCRDIMRSLLRTLTETEQVVISLEHVHALRVKFRRKAQDYTHQYFVDATFNQLRYDRHREEVAVELFEQVLLEAGELYFQDPSGAQIPAWTRALAVVPDLREQLCDAAQRDAADTRTIQIPVGQPDIASDPIPA
ncbi:glucosyl-3-phosphoglycerate synthase [Synechococcales cyanobacterium C]|uniref:Glucosyl-3-phosphoglycerate synthase n=2 Tax=Petrachloros TaxID=2918834 RepID=A0A8K2AGT2_9CYAN|nr:glucosyl-3-phosphoglycerate synthase [Petrachloros mirabilis ULC683]